MPMPAVPEETLLEYFDACRHLTHEKPPSSVTFHRSVPTNLLRERTVDGELWDRGDVDCIYTLEFDPTAIKQLVEDNPGASDSAPRFA